MIILYGLMNEWMKKWKQGWIFTCMVLSEWIYGLMGEWIDDHIIWTYE